MFSAAHCWPLCGRSACRSAANTRSVPSRPSTLIAAVMSAVVSSIRRSAIARTSMPSIPSVPLISASPSFSCSVIGSTTSAASRRAPERVSHRPLPHQRQRAVGERREVAGAAERAVLVDDRRDAVVEQPRVGLRGLRPARPVRPVASVESRSSISARTVSRSTSSPGPRGVAADQAALQLDALLARDVQRRQRAEAGRDAVVRVHVVGERVDRPRVSRDAGERLGGQLDRREVARDVDDLLEGRRADADLDRGWLEHAVESTTARVAAHAIDPGTVSDTRRCPTPRPPPTR